MSPRSRGLLLWSTGLLAACATVEGTARGPEIEVPVFAADDARVGTAGFVAQTLRLHREEAGVRHTLMAFRTGETWTLGAMVKGDFVGEVHWHLDGRHLHMPFSSSAPAGKVPVLAEPGGAQVASAEGASFRGTAWTNVELPRACLHDGSTVQLQFVAATGAVVTLPDAGVSYVLREVSR